MAAPYLRFYSSFAPATILVTLASAWLYYSLGNTAVTLLILFKLLTNVVFWYLVRQLNEKKMYYYYNRNISKARLWLFAFGFDLLLFISLLVTITPRPIPS